MILALALCAALAAGTTASPASSAPVFSGRALTTFSVPRPCTDSARHDAHLSSMRAGSAVAPSLASASERDTLRQATNRAPHLAAMRAGEMSNHDWQLVGIGALIVVALIVIF